MRVHVDERRAAYCALFDEAGLPGDINVFKINKGAITCWHRHQKQTDRFFVVKGRILFQHFKYGQEDRESEMLTDRGDPIWDAPCRIPPGYWHGYEALEDSILIMYLDQKYDPSDEERATPEELGQPW